MNILVLGAGGIGGYFGGMAALAGTDVTFFVREPRARILTQRGLLIETPSRKVSLMPKVITASAGAGRYDVVLLSCKAYDLNSALDAIEPVIGPDTVLLPLLNGLNHYDAIDARFGSNRVLGGFCQIGVSMTPDGGIRRMSQRASIVLGERFSSTDFARAGKVASLLENEDAEVKVSANIARDAWEKLSFLGLLAAATCLLRGTIADIQETERGTSILTAIFAEVCAIAAAEGFPQTEQFIADRQRVLTGRGAPLSSSMYRDVLAGNRVESEHILGDLLRRANGAGLSTPYLAAAHCQLQVYEQARDRAGFQQQA